MKKKIIVISNFDGLSGLRLALEAVPHLEVVRYYSTEIETASIKIANHNFPQDREYRLGDITQVDFKKLGEDIRAEFPNTPIFFAGGSPCTNLSFGGKREGLATTCNIDITSTNQYRELKKDGFKFSGQSYLFWEFKRGLDELKPDYFLLENVRMMSQWKEVFDRIMGVEPIMINSNLLSAQDRIRYYWTNIEDIRQPTDQKIILPQVLDNRPNDFKPLTPYMYEEFGGRRRIDRVRTVNDNKAFTLTSSSTHTGQKYLNQERTMDRRLTVTEWERLQGIREGYTKVKSVYDTARYKAIGLGFTIPVISHILKNLYRPSKLTKRVVKLSHRMEKTIEEFKKKPVLTPIARVGSKERLIAKGLLDRFSDKPTHFYDLFGGGGSVAINALRRDCYDEVHINEIDTNFYELYHSVGKPTFRDEAYEAFNRYVPETKAGYYEMRDEWNMRKTSPLFYLIGWHCFNAKVEYNKRGEINQSSDMGQKRWNTQREERLSNGKLFNDLYKTNKSFDQVEIKEWSMIYLDPPYENTKTASRAYNSQYSTDRLISWLDKMGKRVDVAIAISELSSNTKLVEYAKNNGLNILDISTNINYVFSGKTMPDNKEILITNYI